jgi:predicted nucleotidyltransferase
MFNIEGRYPDYTGNVIRQTTREFAAQLVERAEAFRQCILKKAALNYATRYVRGAIRRNIPLGRAFLFGSSVTGRSHRGSDIDLALIADAFNDDVLGYWRQLAPLNYKFSKVEPHLFGANAVREKDPFLMEIMRKGVEIKF